MGIGRDLGQAFDERHFRHWAGFMPGIRRKAFWALGGIHAGHSPEGILGLGRDSCQAFAERHFRHWARFMPVICRKAF